MSLNNNITVNFSKPLNLSKPKTYFTKTPVLTFRNSVFYPQCIYLFCVDLRTNSDYFFLQHYLYRFFINKAESVYCAVRTVSLNRTDTDWSLKGYNYFRCLHMQTAHNT